jgi:hypothetical protein
MTVRAVLDSVPDSGWIMDHIREVFDHGIRRSGYPADEWAEQYIHDQFARLGLEHVRLEPVTTPLWIDRDVSLTLGRSGPVSCSAAPFSKPTAVAAPLARWDPAEPSRVAGKVAVCDVELLSAAADGVVAARRDAPLADAAAAPTAAGWVYDLAGWVLTHNHLFPFGRQMQDTMGPAIEAGAVGFVGVLRGVPGGGHQYYVPYDAVSRPIPGVYVGEDSLPDLEGAIESGDAANLRIDATRGETICHNVVGELPGADDELVVVGTHHDGPWSSAVEDGSGISLVLAQAATWAAVPAEERPHRMLFLANCGHMSGGAGVWAFLDQHRDDLDRIVLEVHLEHAALDTEGDGVALPGQPTPRWWFTTENADLEAAVWDAIVSESLDRSLMLTPTALAEFPTTDGGPFHTAGVPLVNFLTAPWYLFDVRDTLDKVDEESLPALTRSAARIIASTAGVSAALMREGCR